MKNIVRDKNINAALLGVVTNNGNMGCMALTYSLLGLLEELGRKNSLSFTYFVFDGERDPKYAAAIAANLCPPPIQ